MVEMGFTHEPHWDFYHLATALQLQYYFVPVPQSLWLSYEVNVPISMVSGMGIPYAVCLHSDKLQMYDFTQAF